MGMAASQARLLSITTRLSDNELRSQLINNAKMRLATESSSVSEAYIAALNDTTYMFTNYDSDNNATYQTLTFNSLTAYNEFNTQYGLSNAAGQILVSETDGANFEKSSDLASFLECYGLEYRTTYFETLAETAGGTTAIPTVYDDDYVCYQSLFTVEELEYFYSNDYDNVLISSDFNDYLTLEETYIDAKDAYLSAVENASDSYLNSVTATYNNTNYGIYNIEDYLTTLAGADSSDSFYVYKNGDMEDTISKCGDEDYSEAETYLYAFRAYYQTLLGSDYLNNSTLFDAMDDMFTSVTSTSGTDEYDYEVDDDGKYIYLESDLRINVKSGNVESLATDSSTGETSWSQDAKDWDNDEYWAYSDTGKSSIVSLYTWDSTTLTLSVYDSYVSADSNGDTVYLRGTSSSCTDAYLTLDFSSYTGDEDTGTIQCDYSYNTFDTEFMNSFYYDALSTLYTYFINNIGDTISSSSIFQTMIEAYCNAIDSGDETAQKTYETYGFTTALYNAYNNYVEASLYMEEFIFGTKGILDFEQYQYLDDYRALILSMEYTDSDTSDDLYYSALSTGLTYGIKNEDNTVTSITISEENYETLLAALKAGTLVITNNCITASVSEAYLNVIKAYEMETIISIYGEPSYAYIKDGDYDQNGDAEAEWYTNLYERMCEGYMVLEDGLASSAEWIQYALESGLVKLEQVDSDGEWNAITYTSCSDITETTDDTAVTLAEAEYTKAMNKIEAKDKIYDLELKNIDTEHEALQTEYDSIKNAMDKNIERNFKLYS